MTLKQYIEAYMKEHEISSAREFAGSCGLSHQVINNILEDEAYEPRVSTLKKISEYTGVKMSSLLKMVYPDSYDENLTVTSELVAQAFETAPQSIQEAVLKLVGLK